MQTITQNQPAEPAILPPEHFRFATVGDIISSRNRNMYSYYVPAYDSPFGSNGEMMEMLGISLLHSNPLHLKLEQYHVSSEYYSQFYSYNYRNQGNGYTLIDDTRRQKLRKYGYFITLAEADDKKGPIKASEKLLELAATAKDITFIPEEDSAYYGPSFYHNRSRHNIGLTVTINGIDCLMVTSFQIAEIVFGLTITDDLKLRLSNGVECSFDGYRFAITNLNAYREGNWNNKINDFDYTFDTLSVVQSRLGMGEEGMKKFLKVIAKENRFRIPEVNTNGIKKLYNVIGPIAESIREEEPIIYCGLRTLAAYSRQSVEGVKISSMFNEVLADVKDKESLIKAMKNFYKDSSVKWETGYYRSGKSSIEAGIKNLPSYKEKRKAVLKAKADRAFTKLMEDAESLTLDKKKYKRTWAAIEAGELPIGTFFRKSEQYFLLNDNWDLWEEMFKRGYKQEAIDLANEVKGRSTYEKDLMSYFYFVLYALPEFLKRHTGCKWTCKPKLVNSESELDPPKEEGGVARQRSALTPIVDNESKTVVVPYASLAIYGGFGTTYCYSHDYHVLSKGFSYNGYAITHEIEEKLNGRDDYGLMYYTLTGSAQGRGYPTFLIIFERRERFEDTRVHFHRTHPSRSKEGDYNPIHHWIGVCYNWMAGNINRERIKAQQGDLFFVQVKTDASDETMDGASVRGLEFNHKVDQYDHHVFETPVDFAEYTKAAKSNILGYVRLDTDKWLRHNEHDDVLIPAGTYAIHQCRSWEANPKGVWSLRID